MDIKHFKLHGLTDPRTFIRAVNNQLIKCRDIETIFIDHYTCASRYLIKGHLTFLMEIPDVQFNINTDKIYGVNTSYICSLLACLSSMQSSYTYPINFIFTTKKLIDYVNIMRQIGTSMFIIGLPTPKTIGRDTVIIGNYGLILCTLKFTNQINVQGLIDGLNKIKHLSFLEMESPSFSVVSVEEGQHYTLKLHLKFNPLNSPTQLAVIYTEYIAQVLKNNLDHISWKNECMPYYYNNQRNKHILKQIIKEYCDIDIKYTVTDKIDRIFDIQQYAPCIGLGCLVENNTCSIEDVQRLRKMYDSIIMTNAGLPL